MTKLKVPSGPAATQRASSFKRNITGSVNETIGTGRPAQESIVWLTIQWSFVLGFILTIILAAISLFGGGERGRSPIDEIKVVWGIFIPIITLALGYIFGRNE